MKNTTVCGVVGLVLILLLSPRSSAAVFTIPGGDIVALKSALTESNSNAEDDTIELAPNGTYTLPSVDHVTPSGDGLGLPDILPDGGKTLTINGHGATLQRSVADATPQFGILYLTTGTKVTISALTISHGNSEDFGGAIDLEGSLTLTHCKLLGNTAAGGGGAISNVGNLIVDDCTFLDNSAGEGGVIVTSADHSTTSVQITDSTFQGNSAADGGVIRAEADGFATVTLNITNSTFSGNSATSGGVLFTQDHGDGDSFALLQMTNCTFQGNTATSGSCIYNENNSAITSLQVGGTIFSATGTGPTLSGAITSRGLNLSTDNAGGYLTGPGDKPNTDPQLDPAGLMDHGGATQTIALFPGSPAIDAGGSATTPSRDQRGFFRAGASDLGAYEFQGGLVGSSALTFGGNDAIVHVEVVQGQTYRLERKLSLTDADWQSIADLVATGDDTESITDPGALTLGHAFYRVRFLPGSLGLTSSFVLMRRLPALR